MPKPMLRAELQIKDWVQGLAEIPAAEFTQDDVQRYILGHAILPSSLEPFIFFSSERYTRNLIFKNDVFECLALCWDIGQSSSTHDHNDKLGWIYLASGRLFVQNYHVEERDPIRRTCRLIPTEAAELGADQASYVDREQAVHKVCNLPRFSQRAISVHVYQQPM
ncbi:MAG: cysteine dioxygenase family protein, partial [Candidatus Acidiferrum sp.]